MPSAVKDKPELEIWESWYVRDFYILASERQLGMGIGPIPACKILEFCDRMDISCPEDFLEIIQAMDEAYLDEYNQQQERERASK